MSKPLTVEEVRALSFGDWVWLNDGVNTGYRFVLDTDGQFSYTDSDMVNYSLERDYAEYGVGWFAYRNKEEAEGYEAENCYNQVRSEVAKDIINTIIQVPTNDSNELKHLWLLIKDIAAKYNVELRIL